jgi:transposase
MATYFIALDVHCAFTELAAVSSTGKVVKRLRCNTTIPTLVEALEELRRPRRLTFEEGPLADWLARNLRRHVNELLVCDPRRNHLVAKDGDKDDPIDAEKLAQLYRGGYLREVHQSGSLDRTLLKQHVGFYHDRVRERVRQGQQLVAALKRHGVFVGIGRLYDPKERQRAWGMVPRRKQLLVNLDRLWQVHELFLAQEEEIRQELVQLARREELVRRFEKLPGFGWIRAVSFYAYVDTPWRFRNKAALWKYCGIGLERRHSGRGPVRVRLAKQANRRLKYVLLGAAMSATVLADNPFAEKYLYWTKEEGMHPATARRNVARCQAAVLWSLWKNGGTYDPARVHVVSRPTTKGRRAALARA